MSARGCEVASIDQTLVAQGRSKKGEKMEIGTEGPAITIEPVESPVPAERDHPAPSEPEYEPEPEKAPEREPEKVPA